MKTKQKNNKILPATSTCCGAVIYIYMMISAFDLATNIYQN
jgi:hypothetical protein